MSYSLIYITTSDIKEAKKISKHLIKNRLVVCVNIIPQIESIYHWKGRIENATESVIIARTKKN